VTVNRETLRLGFLTAIEHPADCFVGGLLVTNHLGRPLEFQCTTPVKPNATQKILYGPTLRPFVVCELIGKTLFERAEVKPDLIVVEQLELLSLGQLIAPPVALLSDDVLEPALVGAEYSEQAVSVGKQRLRLDGRHDHNAILKRFHLLPTQADLQEPFERVREALKEVLTTGGGGSR
jgi:hypothetical protein